MTHQNGSTLRPRSQPIGIHVTIESESEYAPGWSAEPVIGVRAATASPSAGSASEAKGLQRRSCSRLGAQRRVVVGVRRALLVRVDEPLTDPRSEQPAAALMPLDDGHHQRHVAALGLDRLRRLRGAEPPCVTCSTTATFRRPARVRHHAAPHAMLCEVADSSKAVGPSSGRTKNVGTSCPARAPRPSGARRAMQPSRPDRLAPNRSAQAR